MVARSLPALRSTPNALPLLGIAVLVGYCALAPIAITSDADNYWMIDLAHPYRWAWGSPDAYVYAPAFAQVIAPLTLLPWEAFYRVWMALNLACLWFLLGPLSPLALLLPFVRSELATGQIHLMLAVTTVLSLRYPSLWGFGLLTKVTPGVTLLWWLARREWRRASIALVSTAVIVAVSALLMPAAWVDWIGLVVGSSTHHVVGFEVSVWPAIFRLPIAAGLVVMAAWRNRPLALPIIVLFALPTIWYGALAMLVALGHRR